MATWAPTYSSNSIRPYSSRSVQWTSASHPTLASTVTITKHETIHKRRTKWIFWWFDEKYPRLSSWCYGFMLGALTAGIALGVVLALWLTSEKTTTASKALLNKADSFPSQTNSITSSVSTSTVVTTIGSTISTTAAPLCPNWVWNTTGETVAGITGSPGSNQNQLNRPWNIYVDPVTNTLYIADFQNHRIQKWLSGATSGTTVAGTSGLSGATATLLQYPKDVFVDASNNIYVADSDNNRIQYFPSGSTTGITISSNWGAPGALWGVQVFNGAVYACDNGKSAIWKNGTAIAGNQGAGTNSSQLNLPQGFSVDTTVTPGTVYIANSQQHTIVQWAVGAAAGTIVAGTNGSPGSSPTSLLYPVSVKLDSYANLFVVDNNNHRIQLFCRHPTINTTGRTIAGTGVAGSTPQTLNFPAGIALDASFNLYVSDTSNHRVQKFNRIV